MFHIILFEPEIPPNTGNIMRLCANTGNQLHLIHPLGFSMDEKRLRRAGLDYIDPSLLHHHDNFASALASFDQARCFAITTKGVTRFTEPTFLPGDAFIFGPETRGLPTEVLAQFHDAQKLRIPMKENQRSLNLSNATAVMVYEAWRQNGFA